MIAPVLDTLERIRTILDLKPQTYLSILRLSESEYQHLLDKNTAPSFRAIERLADELNISPEAILNGKVDFATLAAHFSGNPTLLPDRYSIAARSKRRTSVHLLNSIQTRFGWRIREKILRQLQVNESIFVNPDAAINIHFIVDLCNSITALDPSDTVLFEMGKKSVYANINSKLGEIYRSLPGPKEIYDKTFPELAGIYYDTNTTYRLLEISNTHCVVEVLPNPQLLQDLNTKSIGSSGTCQQKRGAFASLPIYHALPPSKVHEIECLHRGGSRCLFHVDFEFPSLVNQQRLAMSKTLEPAPRQPSYGSQNERLHLN